MIDERYATVKNLNALSYEPPLKNPAYAPGRKKKMCSLT